MNYQLMTFQELVRHAGIYGDTMAKALADKVLELGDPDTLVDAIDDHENLQGELTSLRKEYNEIEEDNMLMKSALYSLRDRAFSDGVRFAHTFSDDKYTFLTDSSVLECLYRTYSPDRKSISAAFVLALDGEYKEVWVTTDNNYYSREAIYHRVW